MNAAGDPDGGRGTDEGITFIEVLIAVVLLGFAAIGILPVFSEQIRGSALQRDFADARRWIVSAGDFAVSQEFVEVHREPCNLPNYSVAYQGEIRLAAVEHRPDGWNDTLLTVTAVGWWNGSVFVGGACPPGLAPLKLQQISFQVVSPNGRVTETLDVVTGLDLQNEEPAP